MEEFGGVELGDKRLNRRTLVLAERLYGGASRSIPSACCGVSETQAAYRYLSNEKVDWEKILKPHMDRAELRMASHPVVLCVQDTTELDFQGRQTTGLGRLSHDAQRGMYLHPTLAITPDREALGVTDLWMWARGPSKASDEENGGVDEGARWVEGYERVAEMAARLPQTRLVYVADREGDTADLMARAAALDTPADWLIRSRHNRALPGEKPKLWDGFTDAHSVGNITFSMPRRKERPGRSVTQTVFARQVKIRAANGQIFPATAIMAREDHPPSGQDPVVWKLLTNRPAQTLKQAAEVIDWYRARWEIEMFFHVLKIGCKVEELQLGAIERIENALALYAVVAWRVLVLLRLGRACPDLSCEVFFQPNEWRAAYIASHKKPPDDPPPLNKVMLMVAAFGGFLGRKGDGNPGVKPLWTGLQRLADFEYAISAASKLQTYA